MIDTVSDTASDFAAVRIDSLHFLRHAEPEGAAEVGVIPAGAGDSAVVKPPAVATEALTHDDDEVSVL